MELRKWWWRSYLSPWPLPRMLPTLQTCPYRPIIFQFGVGSCLRVRNARRTRLSPDFPLNFVSYIHAETTIETHPPGPGRLAPICGRALGDARRGPSGPRSNRSSRANCRSHESNQREGKSGRGLCGGSSERVAASAGLGAAPVEENPTWERCTFLARAGASEDYPPQFGHFTTSVFGTW